MSWQAYIDTSLIGSGHVDKGAIYGLNGGGLWAATPGFEVSPEELKILNDALESNKYDKLQEDGFFIAGTRYVLIKGEGRSIIARQVQLTYSTPNIEALSNCSTTVEGLADYLVKQGY
ncbi:hypothetical protein Golomagni_01585 [Golovinomyces magnicellulatus]|nr:hypothetical protein Golomagni_01585 [Golovinomyces magnicellulatus]